VQLRRCRTLASAAPGSKLEHDNRLFSSDGPAEAGAFVRATSSASVHGAPQGDHLPVLISFYGGLLAPVRTTRESVCTRTRTCLHTPPAHHLCASRIVMQYCQLLFNSWQ